MLKKVRSGDLKVGMYIHDLRCDWEAHPFVASSFLVEEQETIQQIIKAGIRQVVIDTEKGASNAMKAVPDELQNQLEEGYKKATKKIKIEKETSASDEFGNARAIYQEATTVVHKLLDDVRLGKQVEIEHLEPVTESIVNSIFRNKDALISLTRIKQRDQYTFMHSVSVSGLMATFARASGMDRGTIKQVALGGLLHDIGKMKVPDHILNKPGKLTDEEFDIMKSHVPLGMELLTDIKGMSQEAMDVVAMHHERYDGTGYPRGLKGDEISDIGQMSMIVDVYDALTSLRCYKDPWEPSYTLKKLLEWSGSHFKKDIVNNYIRSLGIYPVGSLVQLQSGLVAIVMEQNEDDLLRPDVRVIYNSRFEKYVQVKEIQLRKRMEDAIVQAVSPEKYKIDLGAFI